MAPTKQQACCAKKGDILKPSRHGVATRLRSQRSTKVRARRPPIEKFFMRSTRRGRSLALDVTLPENRDPSFEFNEFTSRIREELNWADLIPVMEAAQPAAVRVEREREFGSGVCVHEDGVFISAGHTCGPKGTLSLVTFPDGVQMEAVCVGLSRTYDIGLLLVLEAPNSPLPCAPLASHAPELGDRVVCIGNHSRRDFDVSQGRVIGWESDDRLANQMEMGGLHHSAWTYWGFSGAPLFNENGEVASIHTSWNPMTTTRLGLTWEAMMSFISPRLESVAALRLHVLDSDNQ